MAKFQVLKKFETDRVLVPGEIVDLAGANLEKLVGLRYLLPLDGPVAASVLDFGPVPSQSPAVAQEPAQPVKRGRGRPRKNPLPAISATETPPA